jgi:hypothetical protein
MCMTSLNVHGVDTAVTSPTPTPACALYPQISLMNFSFAPIIDQSVCLCVDACVR